MTESDQHLIELGERVLGKQIDLSEFLEHVVHDLTTRLEADRGTLYLVDHVRGELVSRVAHLPEISEIRLSIGEGIAGWVAKNGKSVKVPRDSQDPRFAARIDTLTGYQTKSLLAVPIFGENEQVIAVLQLLNKQSGSFLDKDEHLLTELSVQVGKLLQITSLRSQLQSGQRYPLAFRFNHIVGESPAMQEVYTKTARAAATLATVLIRGESGTGKELIARAVHDNSDRHEGPFVKVDCAALPEQLIENELFGHERGAFTGADRASDGKIQMASGGTLFLDEIGELPLAVQGKLLGLLQSKTFFKVGGTRPLQADIRFVCATHRNLEEEVGAGDFRQDLYYRLRVVEIRLPPLRERGVEDLDRLVDHFLYEMIQRHGRPPLELSPAARTQLQNHSWPGNVRELEHSIESAVVLAPYSPIQPQHLPLTPSSSLGPVEQSQAPGHQSPEGLFQCEPLPLREMEKAYVEFILQHCDDNRSAAARLLGIGRNTLNRKLQS